MSHFLSKGYFGKNEHRRKGKKKVEQVQENNVYGLYEKVVENRLNLQQNETKAALKKEIQKLLRTGI